MIVYERDGAAIYRQSFATIRAEADLAGLDPVLERVVVRMIHACGMVDLVADVAASAGFGAAAEAALRAGAPILCDTSMVAAGVTRARLPAGNDVVCTLSDPGVPELARSLGTTRSAAAMELWRERLDGALVVVGNAPTALFRLLEIVEEDGVAPPGGGDRRAGRLRRRGRVQGRARRASGRPGVPRRARPARRQRDGRGRRQRARAGGRVTAPGRLFGVGVGPGDPELVTVKGQRIIGACGVVAYPEKRPGSSVARRAAAPWIAAGCEELALVYPVTTGETDHPEGYEGALRDFYDESAARIAAELDAGRDVAVLCEGDPFFYGSYMYLHERLAGRYTT